MTALQSVAHLAHNALTEFCMLGAMPGTKGLNLSGRWEKVPVCGALRAAPACGACGLLTPGVVTALKYLCLQDKERSELDCYSRQLDLLQIGGIQKATAMKLMNGIDIEHTGDGARLCLLGLLSRPLGRCRLRQEQ